MNFRYLRRLWLSARYAFRPRKPLLFLRLVRTVAGVRLLGKRPLRYVDFALDFHCNLRCAHCFATALEDATRPALSIDDYRRIARECMDLGAVNFSFQGGEPLLLPRLGQIIAAFQPDRNVISVTTNGTMLTPERIRQLRDWGVDILTVSLDSAIPGEHDSFRGVPGTFEKATKGIREALRQGLHVTIGATVSHDNVRSEGIRGLVQLAKELKCVLCFGLAVPAGNWKSDTGVLMTPEDMAYLRSLTKDSPLVRTDFEANLVQDGCGAVKEILYLTPYGDVLSCPFIHVSLGNAQEEPIGAIRQRALKYDFFARYYDKCLCGEDREFIEKYLSRTFAAARLPLGAEEVFGRV